MARTIRYHRSFVVDLAARVRSLRRHRPAAQVPNVRDTLKTFNDRVARFPGIGHEIERRATNAYCVRPAGDHLPYLVWYSYDTADPDGPVSLLMLMHEAQDRERFNPDRFG